VNADNKKLQELKRECCSGAHNAVLNALVEFKELSWLMMLIFKSIVVQS
jgi:hypothetical protein